MSRRIITVLILGGWYALAGILHHLSEVSEKQLARVYTPITLQLQEIAVYHRESAASTYSESPYPNLQVQLQHVATTNAMAAASDPQAGIRLKRLTNRALALDFPLEADLHDEMEQESRELLQSLKSTMADLQPAAWTGWIFWLSLLLGTALVGWWWLRETGHLNHDLGSLRSRISEDEGLLTTHTAFANSIGSGDLNAEMHELAEEDTLGNALVRMRDNLKKVSMEDEKRNWITKGLAFFSDLLREKNQSLDQLGEAFTGNLVKYLGANQGALFLLDRDESAGANQEHDLSRGLKLVACYAYDRKKYGNHAIEPGEGLVGQCLQEGESIYLTDIPGDYIRITSGLGDASPGTVFIVPLKLNGKVYGVVEVASFSDIPKHYREFVEQLGESMASTIASVQANQFTLRLLHDSQKMTEELRTQEEEMRQNIEELRSTQEQIARKEAELRARNDAVDSTLATAEFDMDLRLISANSIFRDLMGYDLDELLGRDHRTLLFEGDRDSEDYRRFRQSLRQGKTQSGEFVRRNRTGASRHLRSAYAVIHDRDNQPEKILLVASDVTRSHQLISEIQQQKDEIETIRKQEKERSDQEINSLNDLMNDYMAQNQEERSNLKKRIKELESQLREPMLPSGNGTKKTTTSLKS